MDYQSYEDYMRQVLGYSSYNPNIYENFDYKLNKPYNDTYYRNFDTLNSLDDEFNDLYPEIYHLVNPMVCKVCSANNQPITKELLEKMTDEIYSLIESNDTIVNVRVETKKDETNNLRKVENERTSNRIETNNIQRTPRRVEPNYIEKTNRNVAENINSKTDTTREVRQSNDYRKNNQTLRDLIKILILKQLLGDRPPVKPPRPNYPSYPGGRTKYDAKTTLSR